MYNYIFDLGGVLINFSTEKLVDTFCNRTNGDYEAIKRLFSPQGLYTVETGRISSQEFFTNHVRKIMPNLTYSELIDIYAENFNPNPLTLNLLERLKNKGRKVYMLSNLAEVHRKAAEIRMPELFSLCDENFLSYEMGYHKPEPEIYLETCRRIGAQPQKCVFFDDTAENVEGAIKIGMKSVLYSNSRIGLIEKYIDELERDAV